MLEQSVKPIKEIALWKAITLALLFGVAMLATGFTLGKANCRTDHQHMTTAEPTP